MSRNLKITFINEDGNEEWQVHRPYSDALEFADAAQADGEVEQPLMDELDEAIEFGDGEDRPDIAGYAREAKSIINQRQLGKN